jgi:di/tricarboxylate transporter
MSGSLSSSSILALIGLSGSVVLGVLDPLGLGPTVAPVAGLVAGTITLFATGAVAEHLTALLFFAVAMVFSIAPSDLVFTGFASKAFWLVVSGLVIGLSINRTGLGARIARALARLFPKNYVGLLAGLIFVAMAISFFMPSSMGRIVLLMPIALALADRYGLAQGTLGRSGVALVVGFACFNPPNGILPATVPNMVYVGAVEKIYGVAPLYGEWMLLHFPLLGLGKAILIWLVGCFLFRQPVEIQAEIDQASPLSLEEKRLACILAFALLGWSTDILHGISPAWIGLVAAILCLLPGIGVLPKDAFKQINIAPAIYVASILGMGTLIADSGLGAQLGMAMADILPLAPGAPLVNFFSLAFGGGVTSLVSTMPGLPAVMVPLAEPLHVASGLPLKTVLASVVLSYSTTILPYQAPPLVLAIGMTGARLIDATKLVALVGILSVLTILPLTFLWWHFLGMI